MAKQKQDKELFLQKKNTDALSDSVVFNCLFMINKPYLTMKLIFG